MLQKSFLEHRDNLYLLIRLKIHTHDCQDIPTKKQHFQFSIFFKILFRIFANPSHCSTEDCANDFYLENFKIGYALRWKMLKYEIMEKLKEK